MNDAACEPMSFEKDIADLECIVKDLEDGQVGLEESLALYEKGVALVRRCQGKLGQVEQRILELLGQDESGQPMTAPFHHAPSVKK